MKKTSCFFLILMLLCSPSFVTHGQEDVCGDQEPYEIFQCRKENICESYASDKPVFVSAEYDAAENVGQEFQNGNSKAPALDEAKKTYRENMGSIYKCALIQSQKNSLSKTKEFIKLETSGELSDAAEGQIDQRIARLDVASSTSGCSLTDDSSQQNKLNILKETTKELCIYTSYLEYMKSYYEGVGQTFDRTNPQDAQILDGSYDNNTLANLTNVTPRELSNDINQTKNEIAREIAHTYKVHPLAFQAYTQYENYYPIHILLEIVKGDFLILRQVTYQVLMPIAQLGLKIINAMSF